GYINGEFKLNPQLDELSTSELDLVVAGTQEGVLMVESEAKELSEDVMLRAVMFGHREFQPVINAIIDLAERAAKEPWPVPAIPPAVESVKTKLRAAIGEELRAAYRETVKQTRHEEINAARDKAMALVADNAEETEVAPTVFGDLESEIVRGSI